MDFCIRLASLEDIPKLTALMETIATLAGEPFYTKFGYRAIEQFEIPLPNNQFLPVVRMFKIFLCSR
jgi:hypothetical protein